MSGASIENLLFAVHKDSDIKVVMAKNEYNAVTMAIGHYMKTREISVAFSTSGGGFLNTVPAIAEAYTSRIPLVVISGQVDQGLAGKGAFQDGSPSSPFFPAIDMVKPITTFCHYVEDADDLAQSIANAFAEARKEKRPSVVFVPKNILAGPLANTHYDLPKPADTKKISQAPQLSKFVEQLTQPEFLADTFMVLGEELQHLGNKARVTQLIETLQIPVALTTVSKGLIDNTHPQLMGLIGIMGHDQVSQTIEQKQNIVLLGCDFNVINFFKFWELLEGKNVFIINEFEQKPFHALNLRPNLKAETCLSGLLNQLIKQQTATHRASFPARVNPPEKEDHFSSKNIVLTLNEFLGENDDIFVDAGNTGANSVYYLQNRKGVFYLSMGMGGMGNSLGGAIGSAVAGTLAGTTNNTYAIMGDGSFMISGWEIHTAIEAGIDLTILIFNNNAHGMCEVREQLFSTPGFVEDTSAVNNFNPAHFGKGMSQIFGGMNSFEVNSLPQLQTVLQQTKNKGGVNLLSLNITADEMPPFRTFVKQELTTK